MDARSRHEHLVDRLVADAAEVRPLWSPHLRLLLWLGLEAVLLGVAVGFGLRTDLADHLSQPLFLVELAAMVAAGGVAAAIAVRGAVPGMALGRSATVAVM